MYLIIWEYTVKPDRRTDFEKAYGSDGAWVELFKKGAGYLGTELLRDPGQSQRYITVDRWVSSDAFNSFHEYWHEAYETLDVQCRDLTEHESLFGTFSTVQPGE